MGQRQLRDVMGRRRAALEDKLFGVALLLVAVSLVLIFAFEGGL